MDATAKLRVLYLAKLLLEQTDETHFLSLAEISEILEKKYGLCGYRVTLQDDIAKLNEVGLDVECVRSTQNQYHVVNRLFEDQEIKLLMEAVASAKFISRRQSDTLIEKLTKLSSKHKAQELKRHVDVEGRVKTYNRYLFLILDAVNDAIAQKKKIAFQYFTYNLKGKKELRHNGYVYVFSPYKLIWNGDYYYMVGYSEKHESIGCFRIDRISRRPQVLQEDAVPIPEDFDVQVYLNARFRMYGGVSERVTLSCDMGTIDSVLDRFGTQTKMTLESSETFQVTVDVPVSSVFFTWIWGFGGGVRIVGPEYVAEQYRDMVTASYQALTGKKKKKAVKPKKESAAE